MNEYIRIPKYIEKELQKASDYVNKSSKCIQKFENWVLQNVREDFDFSVLRLTEDQSDEIYQTEALTEIEYGNDVDIDALERTINYFRKEKIKKR